MNAAKRETGTSKKTPEEKRGGETPKSFYLFLACICIVAIILLFVYGGGRAGFGRGVVIDADAKAAPHAGDMPQYWSEQGLMNVNTAPLELLETLPGIGAVTGQRIIDGRPYGELDDLLSVDGIGAATLENLRDYICVQ